MYLFTCDFYLICDFKKKNQFSQAKTKTTTLPSPLLLTTASRWRNKNNRSEADTNGTHIRRNYNDPDPTEKGYQSTNGLIGASKGMSSYLFLNSLSFVQSIYLHMHVKIHFIIQLYLNHMNRTENKNEAEAAVGDNIGKVFPKFYPFRFILSVVVENFFRYKIIVVLDFQCKIY